MSELLNKIINIDNKLRAARDELEEASCCCRYTAEQQDELGRVTKQLRDIEDLVNDVIYNSLKPNELTVEDIALELRKTYGDIREAIKNQGVPLLKIIDDTPEAFTGATVTFPEYLQQSGYTTEQIAEMREEATQEANKKPYYETFEAHGLKCVLKQHPYHPHMNGYVELPEGHPFRDLEDYELDNKVHVHGGVTFTGYLNEDSDRYYIGFDTMHAGDYWPSLKGERLELYPRFDNEWSIERLKLEIIQLARQVKGDEET